MGIAAHAVWLRKPASVKLGCVTPRLPGIGGL